MKKFFFLLLVPGLVPGLVYGNAMKEAKKEAQAFGIQQNPWEQARKISVHDITPASDKVFDPVEAKRKVKKKEIERIGEISTFLNDHHHKGFVQDEYFLRYSDEICDNKEKYLKNSFQEELQDKTMEKCFEEGEPFKLAIDRQLHFDLNYDPSVIKEGKICKGHHSKHTYYWKKDAKKNLKKKNTVYGEDPTVKDFSVKIHGGGKFSDYTIESKWTHHNSASSCDHFEPSTEKIAEEKWEEQETWVFMDTKKSELAQTPQCTFVNRECLDLSDRNMQGKMIKKCWLERLHYVCRHTHQKGCDFLRKKNCQLKERKCVEKGELGCALWELTFECGGKISRKVSTLNPEAIYGLNDEWENDYEPDHSFSEAMTTLMVFDELKRELERTETFDARQVEFFRGKKNQCSKNVASDLLYDCCFSHAGLATELKLTQCTADELALGQMRDKGLCHYIGSYEEKLLGIWTSSTHHVFCCFPSKLARIVQEEARVQLGIGWGTAKHPECRGLTHEEITQLDFTRLDLSEVYESPSQKNREDRLSQFQENLKKRMSEESNVGY